MLPLLVQQDVDAEFHQRGGESRHLPGKASTNDRNTSSHETSEYHDTRKRKAKKNII